MKSKQGTSPRINLAIPWSAEGRNAFFKMAKDLNAETAAELARKILTEIMLCHFGLEESKRLGIIPSIAMSIPPPDHVLYAPKLFTGRDKRSLDATQ